MNRRASTGFSLMELMVALVVSLVVIAGAISLMVGQQRAFQNTSLDRELQETARIALGQVTASLRDAGFGVDPALTFDLGPMNNVRMDLAPGGLPFAALSTQTGAGVACAGLCRDSTVGPDEIVFYSRDPSFGPHPLTVAANASSNSLTVALVPSQSTFPLQKGQLLQVACYSGNMTWAYVTVSGTPTLNGNGTVTIPIANSGSSTYPNQNAFLADNCFSSTATVVNNAGIFSALPSSLTTAAEVFKVDRYHYYILTVSTTGAVVGWGTAGARPYLMMDQGLLDASNAVVRSVVAPDVEDLQFEYIFPYDTVTPLVGATPGTPIAQDDTGLNLAPANLCPAFSDATNSLSRLNHHPGNIGAVRIGLVIRSADQDIALVNSSTVPAAGNRPALPGPSGYSRLFIETTVAVPNLSNQAPYFPSWGSTGLPLGTRTLNVGGG